MVRRAAIVVLVGCETLSGTSDSSSTSPTSEPTPVSPPTDSGSEPKTSPTPPEPDPYGIVSAHNAVRAAAQPVPMPPLDDLVWDDALAAVAAGWAAECLWQHSVSQYGENLYASSWESNGSEVVEDWASEIAYYDYATNSCSDICGHYTQIVWRDTARVGCAYVDCPAIQGLPFGGRMWVCNYDPPGNYIGERPY